MRACRKRIPAAFSLLIFSLPLFFAVVAVNHAPSINTQVLFIDESAAAVVGAVVGTVAASDPDNPARTAGSGRPAVLVSPSWYALTYNVSANAFSNVTNAPLFRINTTSGALSVAASMTWTVAQGQQWFMNGFVRAVFALSISVCNPTVPALCSTAPLTLAVTSNYSAPLSPLVVSLSLPTGGLGTLGGDAVSFQGVQLSVGALTRAVYCSNITGICYNATCTCAASSQIACTTAPGFGSAFRWALYQNGVQLPSVAPLISQYAAPVLGKPVKALCALSSPLPKTSPPPILFCIAGAVAPSPSSPLTSAGGLVLLTGRNFGPPAALPFITVAYGAGSQFSMTPVAVNQTMLTAVLGPGCGSSLPVTVSVAGLQSSSPNPAATVVTFAPPSITALSPASGAQTALSQLTTLGGEDVWIDGQSFGPMLAGGVTATYSGGVGGYEYSYSSTCRKDDASRAHTRVICTTAPGVSANFTWRVVVCGQASAPATQTTSYAPPVLLGVLGPGAVNAATDGGQSVTLRGNFFGPLFSGAVQGSTPTITSIVYGAAGGPRAWLYSPTACAVTSASPALITCLSAPGTGANLSWRLSIGGQESNILLGASSYGAPVVSQFLGAAAVAGPAAGGPVVTLQGFNFGSDPGVLFVSYAAKLRIPRATDGFLPGVNGTVVFVPPLCSITVPHHTLQCALAPGAGAALSWSLVVDGQQSTAPYTSFAPPVIAGVALLGGAALASPDGGVSLMVNRFQLCADCP